LFRVLQLTGKRLGGFELKTSSGDIIIRKRRWEDSGLNCGDVAQ